MKPPIFVVGSGRSGTTLLYDILTQHADLGWVSNLSNRLPGVPSLAALSRLPALRRFRAFRPASEAIEGYARCGVDETTINPASADSIDVEAIAHRTRAYFEAHSRAWGRSRIVSKNTAHSMRIDLLNEMFPDARFVHIHRHPYSVIASLIRVGFWPDLNLWWDTRTPRELEAAGRHPIEIAGTHWARQVDCILTSLSKLPAGRVHQLSYESLVRDPETQIREMATFCDLPDDAGFQAGIASLGVSTSSLDKWKTAADANDYRHANPAVAALATRLGYELMPDTDAPVA